VSRLSRTALARRLYLAAPAWSLVVGLLVLLTSALLVAAPRASAAAAGTELRQAIADVRGAERDLAAVASGGFHPGSGSAPGLDPVAAEEFGALEEQLAAFAASADPALQARLGAVDYAVRSGVLSAPSAVTRPGVPISNVRIGFDPRIFDRVEIIDGAAPAAADGSTTEDPATGLLLADIEVMMSADSAARVEWEVGEVRLVREIQVRMRLTGTFEAVDPDAIVWQHVPSVLQPEVFDDGNAAARSLGTVYVAPGTLTTYPDLVGGASRLTVWYPFDAAGLTLDEAQTIVAELRKFTQARDRIPAIGNATLRFSSGTLDAIERVLDRSTSTTALLALVGSGPLGVAAAVLGLAAQGVVVARRPTLELAAARGASPGSLRRALAAEGALVGIPSAALGLLLALWFTPGPLAGSSVVVAAVIGVAPAAVFAARASFPLGRARRQDLGVATPGRVRLAVDLVVSGLAVVATVLLVIGGGRTVSGVDPLAVLAPLLLATAAALLAERLLPAPAGAALARAAAGPRLAGFLGLARAVREPSGSVAHLALVVAIAIGTASAVLLTTLDRGTIEAAEGALGGDVRAEGAALTAEEVDELGTLPGVAAVAGIEAIGPVTLTFGAERSQVPAYVVDGAALAGIQNGFPAGLDSGDEPVPFVVSPALGAALQDADYTIEGSPAALVGVAGGAAGVGGGEWLMVDRSASGTIGAGSFSPRVVVASVATGADPGEVAASLSEALDGQQRVSTLDEQIAAQRATPIPNTLRVGFVIAIGLAALLAVAAILMSARLAAAGRTALAGTLRRLGAERRTAAAVFGIEALPATLAALLIGGVLGAAIPFLVVAAVDLGPIVGGIAPPVVVVDPLTLGAVVLGALLAGALSLLPVLLTSRKESA
jgi:putative ABC transport system permease protein